MMVNFPPALEQKYLNYVAFKKSTGNSNVTERQAWKSALIDSPSGRWGVRKERLFGEPLLPFFMPHNRLPAELSELRNIRQSMLANISDFFSGRMNEAEFQQFFVDSFHRIRQFNVDIGVLPEGDKASSLVILIKLFNTVAGYSVQYARNETARAGNELARAHSNGSSAWVYLDSDLILSAERVIALMNEAVFEITSELDLTLEELEKGRGYIQRETARSMRPLIPRIIAGDQRFLTITNPDKQPPAGFSFFYTINGWEQVMLVGNNTGGETVFTKFKQRLAILSLPKDVTSIRAMRLAERLNPRLNFSRNITGFVNAFDFFNSANGGKPHPVSFKFLKNFNFTRFQSYASFQ